MTSIPILWKTVCRCRFLDKLHCVIIIVCYQICLYHSSDTGLSSSPTEQTTNTTLFSFTANISDLLCPLFSCTLVLHSSFNLHFFPLTFTFQITLVHFTTLPHFSLSPSRSVPSALLDLGYFPFVFISLSCSL